MSPIAFSFHGLYIPEGTTTYTVAGNALVLPADYHSNSLKEDLLVVTYWVHNFGIGKDYGGYRIFLKEKGESLEIGTIDKKTFVPVQKPFLGWLKDLVEQTYNKEKKDPQQISPFAPDFSE